MADLTIDLHEPEHKVFGPCTKCGKPLTIKLPNYKTRGIKHRSVKCPCGKYNFLTLEVR